MFLHWTIVPYCMYTVPAVVFAFMYYNAKKPYSIASEVSPLLGDRCYHPRWMQTIDAITLFAIGAGMAGSVAQAFMNISGGISKMLGLPSNARLWFMVGIVVAAVTVATAVSGIQKAMKHVSNINVYGFAIFLIFLLVFSNASFLFNLSTEALGGFAGTFIERILITGESVGTQYAVVDHLLLVQLDGMGTYLWRFHGTDRLWTQGKTRAWIICRSLCFCQCPVDGFSQRYLSVGSDFWTVRPRCIL